MHCRFDNFPTNAPESNIACVKVKTTILTPPPECESIIWLLFRSRRLIYRFIQSDTLA
jgi:hypothetical protein